MKRKSEANTIEFENVIKITLIEGRTVDMSSEFIIDSLPNWKPMN